MPLPERSEHYVQVNASPSGDQTSIKCPYKKNPMQVMWNRLWHPKQKYDSPSSATKIAGRGSGDKDGLWVFAPNCTTCFETNLKQIQ